MPRWAAGSGPCVRREAFRPIELSGALYAHIFARNCAVFLFQGPHAARQLFASVLVRRIPMRISGSQTCRRSNLFPEESLLRLDSTSS